MLTRLLASLLALASVAVMVLIETLLSNMSTLALRSSLYDALSDLAMNSPMGLAAGDAMAMVIVYTLPECLTLLALYHVYAWALGLLLSDPTPMHAPSSVRP